MNKVKCEDEIINQYNKGIEINEICKNLSISNSTIDRVRKRFGLKKRITPRKQKPPKHDLTGKKFFHLTVEKMEKTNKSKDRAWRCICKCDCGQIADVNTNYIMRGLAKTCGKTTCQFHRQDYTNSGKSNVKFTGYEEISGQKWASIRLGAESRNLEFNITLKHVWDLFVQQNRKCSITNKDIYFGKTNTMESTASLDRINSSKGYIEGNVQWVHKDINTMKWNFDFDYFVSLCNDVVKNNL